MQFAGKWRDYQQRVLDEFEEHFADKRLHVVAAPGSGKTVLGLELIRRIDRPALVLAPTKTIRDQWLTRLVPLFMAQPPGPEDVSHALDAPRDLTVATYQALHAHWAEEEGTGRWQALIAALHAIGPVTLVLDEAHHLRREWWNALQTLVDALPEAHLIALTATPPYDAPFAEWTRYETLCGPIDLEIGVPELVRNGDLAPHQDHIFFSMPEHETLALLDRRRSHVAALQAELRADTALIDFFLDHPWLKKPEAFAEAILEMPEFLGAILVLIAASGRSLPSAPLKMLGIRRGEIQPMEARWLEVLLNGLLFRFARDFPIGEERTKWLRDTLHEHSLIEGGQVSLTESRSIFSLMSGSLAKLNSMTAIARAEAESLGAGLRMVVLSDHVRAGDLPRASEPHYKPAKLGVVPIFETLRRADLPGQHLAILTGTLIILPETAAAPLRDIASGVGIAPDDLLLANVPGCPDHRQLRASGEGARRAVELVTALFMAGHVTILVGTQSLLGEGWDAPAINSLVLASNSAAFMLSNQMRGRAIRIDPADPAKVSNIWHLATIEPVQASWLGRVNEQLSWARLSGDDSITSDADLLERRFRTFECISNGASTEIENGIARLGLPAIEDLAQINSHILAIARDRQAIAERWRRSIGAADERAHVREVATPNYAPRALPWQDTLQWLVTSAAASAAAALCNELRQIDVEGGGLAMLGMIGFGGVALASGPKLYKAIRLLLRNGSLEGSLHQVGTALMSSLHYAGLITDSELLDGVIEARRTLSGRIDLRVHGVARATERLVLTAMAEILGPVQNPRYLLVRYNHLGPIGRADYHAVPTELARRKEWADGFRCEWETHVGPSKLVFARTVEGRAAILKARARSLAAGFQRRVDRRSAWS